MTSTGDHEHLRPGAMALLDEGNTIESVSRVLGVPVSLVQRWRASPPASPAAPAAPGARPAANQAIRFKTTLTFGESWPVRLYSLGLAALVVVIALPTWSNLAVSRFTDGLFVKIALLATIGLPIVFAVSALLRRVQTRLILGPDAAIVPHLFGRTVLPYAEMSDYWLVMHIMMTGEDNDVEIEGRLLTLHSSRKGVRPIELFIDDRAHFDDALVERLDAIKQANRGEHKLTRMGSFPAA